MLTDPYNEQDGFDGSWKTALDHYFYECLELLTPNIYKEINTDVQPEFLDKELQSIFSKAKYGVRLADKLVINTLYYQFQVIRLGKYISKIKQLELLANSNPFAIKEGIEIGLLTGQSNLLTSQLQHRFGELPVEVTNKVKSATLEQIQAWSMNILDAKTLPEVFK